MKTTVTKDQVLSKFYVAVLYKWHPYFPDYPEKVTKELKDKIIKDATSEKKLYLSSTIVSDLIEFAEYKFNFKTGRENYKEYLLNNFLDTESRKVVGSNFRDLQKIENYVIPQLSKEVRDWDDRRDGYFGAINLDNNQICLIDVPENFWKIEIYPSDIFDEDGNMIDFIEYSVRKGLNIETSYKEPLLSLELGPDSNCYNNDKSMYYEGDGLYDENKSAEMIDRDYVHLYQEITDRKVFYIVQTPSEISSINIALMAWNSAKVPHKNKKEYNVNNNYYSGKILSGANIFDDTYDNTLFDNNNTVLLGNGVLDKEKYPILSRKISRASVKNFTSGGKNHKHSFKENVVYEENEEIFYKGVKYKSLISGNIWDNPVISGNWIKVNNDNTTLLDKIEKEKKYRSISILSDGGNVLPNGNASIKVLDNNDWYKKITVEEQLGYLFNDLVIDNKYVLTKSDLNNYLNLIKEDTYSFSFRKSVITKKLGLKDTEVFKTLNFRFVPTLPKINIIFDVPRDYYASGLDSSEAMNQTYTNSIPEGLTATFTYDSLSDPKIFTSGDNFNGVVNKPLVNYDLEIKTDGSQYVFKDGDIHKYTGIVDKNNITYKIPLEPREFEVIFDGYIDHGISVNGDSSRVCYYGQSCVIEFSFEDDKDSKGNYIYKHIYNHVMKERLGVYIEGQGGPYKIGSSSILNIYGVTLEGGGDNSSQTSRVRYNNYFLTINKINAKFTIIYKQEGYSEDEFIKN